MSPEAGPSPISGRVLRALALACALGLSFTVERAASEPADGQPANQSAPSEPPFWARPRPVAPVCPPDTNTPGLTTPATSSSGGPSPVTGILGLLVLGLTFLLWRQRRQLPPPEVYIPRSEVTPAYAPPLADGMDPRVARLRLKPSETSKPPEPVVADELALTDPRAIAIELAEDEPGAESAGAQAFYTEIAHALTDTLRHEPGRQDLRRKLLEVYFLARRTNDFVNLAHEYLETNSGRRDEFWPDIGTMGLRLAPEHEMFREFGADARPAPPSNRNQQRRFHERNVDQGKMYAAQQMLTADFERLKNDAAFHAELSQRLADSVRRPAPLLASPELAYVADGAQIFIKHEDRRRFHDDVMINATAQMMMAQKLGRTRVVTATRDCVHGHAVASAAARLGIECGIYITERDLNRYYTRVLGMRRLGAQMRPIQSTAEEPVDPRHSAMDAWLDDPDKTQFISGLSGGPTPFPEIVREFQCVVGRETRQQLEQMAGVPPTAVIAGMADGHLGLGLLTGFLDQTAVQLYCVEEKPAPVAPEPPGGSSLPEPLAPGVLTRREHHWLRDTGRISYVTGDEQETLRITEQFHATGTSLFTHSARTMAYARALARRRERKEAIVVLLVNQEAADMRGPRNDW